MMKLAANLSFLFTEARFLDRFERAAAVGFRGVEYLFPYDYSPSQIAARLSAHGLTQVLFNTPAGDWAGGERGYAAVAGRESDFRASLDRAIPYIEATGVRLIHVLAGIASHADPRARETYLSNLTYAAQRLAVYGATILIEPLNARDMPGYFLADFDDALGIIETLGLANVRLQFDIYHRQIIRGDVTSGLRAAFPMIGHVQIAGVPSRGEPDHGELTLSHILGTLDHLGYDGWIGCEYHPRARTDDGLTWIKESSVQKFLQDSPKDSCHDGC